ncbi:inner membrane protein yrbG [Vibrio ishigakensis]|uniref:Inner membrane protein yrbG n=1 Tax=Vibrio ishigakensis TaxID=1481914 RepID=A0A0B8PDR8_9VIBR|nr:inner membrane protein yrbG [Vibrio ishigakensis]
MRLGNDIGFIAIFIGLMLLVWSAERFVDGAAATATHAGMSPLLIGMLVVGFGTSAPEMVVSAMAAIDGNPELALGNALGSNIVNTGLILGVTALIAPIMVQSVIVKKELPLLLVISLLLGIQLLDGSLTRVEAAILLVGFIGLIIWSIYTGTKQNDSQETKQRADLSLTTAIIWLVTGLILLVISSRILVWGAVTIAQSLGVSDLIIGLTVVALGTSLPELAASVVAARKGEHDIAIGNIVGSNMFNILAVVGIAGMVSPISEMSAEVLSRDWPVMLSMTLALFFMAFGFGRQGRINRLEGAGLLLAYSIYTGYLIFSI